jgi:hypothetical protein
MFVGRGPRTASEFHAIISAFVGGGLPACAHEQDGAALAILLGAWAALQLFIFIRTRRGDGIYLDERGREFAATGIGGFFFGLLSVAIVLVAWK